jgi:hypothetical protein
VAGLLGFDDLEDESRRFLAALHQADQNADDVRASTESLLQAAQRVELELDTIA